MSRSVGILIVAIMLAMAPLGDAFCRGFGGFRGGGFSSEVGGFRSGGFDRGGFGESRDRSFDGGGFSDRRFGGFQRSYGNGFQRERTESYRPPQASRPVDDRWRGNDRYDADRPRPSAPVSRTQLDHFLSLPTDAGIGHVAPPYAGKGFEGSRVTSGLADIPWGASGAIATGKQIRYIPPDVRSAQAWTVRNDFSHYNLFTPAWYADHPNAWRAVAKSAWAAADWFGTADWVGCDASPVDYEYGGTVTYQDNNVYVEGQPVGSEAQYYDQASTLATSGAGKQDDQSQWMSLGVFTLAQSNQTDPTMIFQLAVNRQGVLRGNYFNTVTQTTLPVHGAVDKKTQRVAWTIGDNKNTVFDTGLINLTEDQAPILVHLGKDRTQQWLMVRVKGKDGNQDES